MESLEFNGLRWRELYGWINRAKRSINRDWKNSAPRRICTRKQSSYTLNINLKLRSYSKWLELLQAINSDAAKFARIHYYTTPSARLRNLMIYDIAR